MRIKTIVALAGLVTAALFAQERGVYSGKVTDPQGSAIPGATVIATEIRTGTKTTATSEATGAYSLPFLAPGEYEITVDAPGFKRFLRRGLTLSAGETPVIDVSMELGAASESVTVTGDAPLIQTANASTGQVVTTREVEDIPINGRAPIMLTGLAMGVINTAADSTFNRPFDGPGGSFTMGGVSGSNEILLDGAPNSNTSAGGQSAYSPPQDAVAEVSVSGFQSDAAYGHAGGGTMNLITKSGTNAFHFTGFEFNQVSDLDANLFFYNAIGEKRSNYNFNQYGMTAGGPVWVPKLFNGKNRVFWMFAYEGLRDGDPSEDGVVFATVPTPAERQGDFSSLLKVNSSYTIYDPATGVVSGSQILRTPFPNNVIPTNRLNPVAQNYLQYYPQPNYVGRADGYENYYPGDVDHDSYNSELGRLDVNLGSSNRLAFNYRNSARTQDKRNFFHNISTGNFLFRNNEGASLDDVDTITPSTVLDVRANWTQYFNGHASRADGFNPSTLGFPSYLAASSEDVEIPAIVFATCAATSGAFPSFQCLGPEAMQTDDHVPENNYQLFGDVVKSWGNHTTKVGADIRDHQYSSYTAGYPAGVFDFNIGSAAGSDWTNGPLSNAASSPLGQDFAAFLLGLPSTGEFDVNSHSTFVNKYYAWFVQDDWRVKPGLTINLGVRWEHESPTTERYDRVVDGFNPTASNPISAAAAAAYAANPQSQIPANQFSALGGLTFASPGSPNIYNSNSHIFSPRFGVAWTPNFLGGKTVVRGGFGVFVSPLGIVGLNQEGFSQVTQYPATTNNYLTPTTTLSNPFPNGIAAPAGSANGTGTFLGQQVTFYNPHTVNPYSSRWDFSIQHQLPGNIVLEVAYTGNHAVHLTGNIQLDEIPRKYLSTSLTRDTTTINLLTSNVPNPFKGLVPNSTSLNGSTVSLQQLLIPFPQYPVGSGTSNGVIEQGANAFSSSYESLNVRLQKRLAHGMTILNNFVWSSELDRTIFLNDTDPAPTKQISANSRPLHESLAVTYELPLGRGKLINLKGLNPVLGGWAVNGVLTLQSGPPLAWGNVLYYGGPLDLTNHQPYGPVFNTSRFNTVASQQLTDNIRTFDTMFNDLRRDPTKNLDMSAIKSFPIHERS